MLFRCRLTKHCRHNHAMEWQHGGQVGAAQEIVRPHKGRRCDLLPQSSWGDVHGNPEVQMLVITRPDVSLITGKKPIRSRARVCPTMLVFKPNGPTRQLRRAISPPIHFGAREKARMAAVLASKAMPSTISR